MRARIDAMDGGIFTFLGFDPARCRPIAYPLNGTWFPGFSGAGRVSIIYSDNRRIGVDQIPPGYVFSVGDLISINGNRLYSVVQGAVANEDGEVSEIEVRSWLWPDTSVGQAVSVLRPSCLMAINPDELTEDVDITTGKGSYSFTAWEVP